ncbi:MAG: hypothetical protein GX131_19130 [candidate division WS1 bacterium]|jgi:uncharacterized membrane protein (GlpM family)|nr:hypothetical protein [candidate division WS1 bacterium]
MTVADEGDVYWELYQLIVEYGRSGDPFREAIAMRLFAVKPGNVPLAECWDVLKGIFMRTDWFVEEAGVHAALAEAIVAAWPYLEGDRYYEAIDILERYCKKVPPGEGNSEFFLSVSERALEELRSQGPLPYGFAPPHVPDEAVAREQMELVERMKAEDGIVDKEQSGMAGMGGADEGMAFEDVGEGEAAQTKMEQKEDVKGPSWLVRDLAAQVREVSMKVTGLDATVSHVSDGMSGYKEDVESRVQTALRLGQIAVGGLLTLLIAAVIALVKHYIVDGAGGA